MKCKKISGICALKHIKEYVDKEILLAKKPKQK